MVSESLGYKVHWAVADYLQRASRHIGSKVDVQQAYDVGAQSVKFLISGISDVMVTVEKRRKNGGWSTGKIPLGKVANRERKLPRNFIGRDGFSITKTCAKYIQSLINGESFPPFINGIPNYSKLKLKTIKKLK